MPPIILRAEWAIAPDVWQVHTRRFRLRLRDPQGQLIKSALWKRKAEDRHPSTLGAYHALCAWFAENPEYDIDPATVGGADLYAAMQSFTATSTAPAAPQGGPAPPEVGRQRQG